MFSSWSVHSSSNLSIKVVSYLLKQYLGCLLIIIYTFVVIYLFIPLCNISNISFILQFFFQTIKMLITLVVIFFITWMPPHVMMLIGDVKPAIYVNLNYRLLWFVLHFIAASNSGTNSFIYLLMNTNCLNTLRRCTLAVVCCKNKKQSRRTESRRKLTDKRNSIAEAMPITLEINKI